jgi:hypothetical protein
MLLELLVSPQWVRSNEDDFLAFRPKCKRYWIWNYFLSLETQLNYKKLVVEGEISCVTSSHLG